MREKVTSIKENYDKKFEELFMQFKNIESLFLQGYFEKETLGDIKNSKRSRTSLLSWTHFRRKWQCSSPTRINS